MDKEHKMSRNSALHMALDKRSENTRQKLRQTLSALLLKQNYDQISVSDICKSAQIGRSTFYLHYADKDDLKREGIKLLRKQLLSTLKNAQPKPERALSFSLPILEHAKAHADHFRALAGSRGSVVALQAMRETVRQAVRQELGGISGRKSAVAPASFAVTVCVESFMAILLQWLETGHQQSPQEVDAFYQLALMKGLFPAGAGGV